MQRVMFVNVLYVVESELLFKKHWQFVFDFVFICLSFKQCNLKCLGIRVLIFLKEEQL